jgi:50S ribosomal subunit-associated GTPase HflX
MRGHIFVLVHDVIDSVVVQDLEKWRQEIIKKKPARHTPVIIVVSNKIDLAPFCTQEVSSWLEEHTFDHVYTSAKTGDGIDTLFTKIKDAITVHQSDWLSPSLPAVPIMPEMDKSPGCAC